MNRMIVHNCEIIIPFSKEIKVFDRKKIFLICDTLTKKHCIPLFKKHFPETEIISYCIPGGESSKNLRESDRIIRFYIENNVNRNDIVVALGGGVVCDITGFTASVFKRGIRCIYFPTTLLGMVDAAIGGKNGIDYMGFKNLLGNFYDPEKVVILPEFLITLDERHLTSGKAEVLKTLLLGKSTYLENILKKGDIEITERLISECIRIKSEYVNKDYSDRNERHALNLGHTIGHAIEAYSLSKHPRPLLHGEAVAAGLMCEIFLSYKTAGLDKNEFKSIVDFIAANFLQIPADCLKYENLEKYLKQDKKNYTTGTPSFTLLSGIGKAEIKKTCSIKLIKESLKFYSESYK